MTSLLFGLSLRQVVRGLISRVFEVVRALFRGFEVVQDLFRGFFTVYGLANLTDGPRTVFV